MLRRFLFSVLAVALVVTFAYSDEFIARITKVDGNKVTYQKGKKGEDKKFEWEEAKTVDADKVGVFKAMFDKDTKKVTKGEAVEGGLTNAMFKDIGEKGVRATIVTDDAGKVTSILIGGGGKKGKKDTQ